VHNQKEFSCAVELGTELVGINNRDLHTFRTDLATTANLLARYSGGALIVSESGIETPAHLRQLYACGAGAFLIGESLLRGGAPRLALSELMNRFGEDEENPAAQGQEAACYLAGSSETVRPTLTSERNDRSRGPSSK
jgi:Indole-3-glycerol phosphate synthase